MKRRKFKKDRLSLAIALAIAIAPSLGYGEVTVEDSSGSGDWVISATDYDGSSPIYSSSGTVVDNSSDVTALEPLASLTINANGYSGTGTINFIGLNVDNDSFSLSDGLTMTATGVGTSSSGPNALIGVDQSAGSLSAGDVSLKVTGTSYITGAVEGVFVQGGTSTVVGNVAVEIGGSAHFGTYLYGVRLETYGGVDFQSGDISVTVNSGATSQYPTIRGYFSNTEVYSGTAQTGSITVSIDNLTASGDDEEVVQGIYKYGYETLTVNGDVNVSVTGTELEDLKGVWLLQGSATINGNISLVSTDVTYADSYGSSLVGLFISSNGSGTITGDVSVTLQDDTDLSGEYTESVFAVGLSKSATGSATVNGDAKVILAGTASNLGLGTHSVYGVVNATGDSSRLSFSGKSYLYFGIDSDEVFSSTSSAPFESSFSNFDAIVVNSGSSLSFTSGQNISLIGDATVFSVSRIGTTGTYRPVLTFVDFLNGVRESTYVASGVLTGIVGMGGVLNLPDGTSLEIMDGGSASISMLQNEVGATVTMDSGATLTLDASKVTASVDDATATGSAYNNGTITGDGTLILQEATSSGPTSYDTYSYTGTATTTEVTWESGAFSNTGKIDVSNMTVGDGVTFNVLSGSVKVSGNADLSASSTINIGADSPAQVQMNATSVNATVYAYNASSLSFGTVDDFAVAKAALSDAGVSQGSKTMFVVNSPITTGNTGLIVVGSDTATDGITYGVDLTGANSLLVVNTSNITVNDVSSAALTYTGDGTATFNVDKNATVVLYGNNLVVGRYYITNNYELSDNTQENWTNDNSNITLKLYDSAGIEWEGTLGYDLDPETYVDVTGHEAVGNLYLTNIPNIVEDYYGTSSAGGDYVTGVLRDTDLTTEQKINIINSSSAIAFAGGVLATAMNDMNAGFGSLYNHLLMIGSTFGDKGNIWPYEQGNNLWIDVLGNWNYSRKLGASGINEARYHDYSFGFVMGYDRKLGDLPVMVGGAFSFTSGQLKSTRGVSRTKNDHQSYGAHIYANYSPYEYLNVIGSLHWLHNNADLTQSIGVADVATQAKASPHTNIFAVGLRFESTFRVGDNFGVIPHIEPRYLYSKTGKYDTFVDGAKVWSDKNKGNSLFQIPVGVGFRGNFQSESGWNWRPNLDVQVIPQAGSTRQHTTVTNINNVSDVIYGEYMGKFAAEAKLGVQAQKGPFTIGAKYGVGGGTKGKFEHGFILQGRFRF